MEFNNEVDKEFFLSMGSLKKNNGYFKSAKQRDYFKRQGLFEVFYKNFSLAPGQFVICVSGHVRFADYGIKSVRRVEWLFVCDDLGIVKQLKIRFEYSADGRYSSPSGVYDDVWKRDTSITAPVFEVVEQKPKHFVGDIGQRLTLEGTVKVSRKIGETAFGPRFQTIIETDDGGVLVYWNLVNCKTVEGNTAYAEQGDRVRFSAGIKAFEMFRDVPQTHLSRVTKAEFVS